MSLVADDDAVDDAPNSEVSDNDRVNENWADVSLLYVLLK